MIPLRHARLCADCDVIYDGRLHRAACPACAFHVTAPVARWLNRPAQKEPTHALPPGLPRRGDGVGAPGGLVAGAGAGRG